MQADRTPQAQDQTLRVVPTDERPDDPPASYVEWQQLGRQALYVEPRTRLKTLSEVLAECAALVVVETWLAHAHNLTRTSDALGISRKRVRRILKAWHAARERAEPLGS